MAVIVRDQSTIYGLTEDLDQIRNAITTETDTRIVEDQNLQTQIDDLKAKTTVDSGAIQAELDVTQTGAGLNTDGTYTAPSGVNSSPSNYLTTSTSLYNSDLILDSKIKANYDEFTTTTQTLTASINANASALSVETQNRTNADAAIQAELDTSQSSIGLNSDGTYTAPIGANYIHDETTIVDALVELDSKVFDNEQRTIDLARDKLAKDSNLSDLTNIVAARANLEVLSASEVFEAITTAELNLGSNISVADLQERDSLPANSLTVGDNVFVTDDGDTKWAIYKVTAIDDGSGLSSTFIKIMDQDLFVNAQDSTAIKASYEMNANTNAFTDKDKTDVAKIDSMLVDIATIDDDLANTKVELESTQAGAGLNTDGTYTPNAGSYFIKDATTLADALNRLDAQASFNKDGLASEITNRTAADDAINNTITQLETSVNDTFTDAFNSIEILKNATIATNLDANGVFVPANGSNYISTATSLYNATVKLDSAIKTLDDNTYDTTEIDNIVYTNKPIFVTEVLVPGTLGEDLIELTNKPYSGMIFNFATVRHTDSAGRSYDIPVTLVTKVPSGKVFKLHPNSPGDFDGKNVTIQYAYLPV